MRKLVLLLGLALCAATAALPAKAAVVGNLGVNPTSAQGDFANTVGGSTFTDFWLFQLVGGPEFVTLASATNVFPLGASSTDFITNFAGEVFQQLGATPDPTTDHLVLGPALPHPCADAPTTCQELAGSALLVAGNYYLDISGTGGGTSGYGGNLAVAATPLPGALGMFGGGLALFVGLFRVLRRRGPVSIIG